MATASAKNFCMVMEIPEISELKEIWSPAMPIHGIEWKVKVCKMGNGDAQSLAAFLCCCHKDKTPYWSLWGDVSFKLLPFSDDGKPIELHGSPQVFDASGDNWGTHRFIKWNELIKEDNKYVKDDTINLEIEVKAENPNDPNRSRMNFECIHKCCGDCQLATFRLTVANALNLMAVQSPPFTLHGFDWNIQISKRPSSHLGVVLRLMEEDDDVPITVAIKLVSTKNDVIKNRATKWWTYLKPTIAVNVITWDELIKPENGFVNDGSITLKVRINVNDPKDDAPSAKRLKLNPGNEIKSPQMECPICFKRIANQELAVTTCGHMFCFECIKKELTRRAVCPSCNKAVRSNALRQIYLPAIN